MDLLKKIIAIILLIALAVNLMGYFVIFQCNRFLLRREMTAMIRAGTYPGKLETIKIVKDQTGKIRDFSDDNEFFYHGILYDLVASTSTNNAIIFTCIRDNDEQSLVSRFSQYLHTHAGDRDAGRAGPIILLVQHLLIQAMVQKTISQKTFTASDFTFPVLVCPLSRVLIPKADPPPKTC